MAKTTRLDAGYLIRNKVAIYGGGHVSVGREVWRLWRWFNLRYPTNGTWLEFGANLSFAYYSDGVLEAIEEAHCTGLTTDERSRPQLAN